ncbi:MAG: zinc ABC transporter substrate-binding protein [Patescibacteria group bacterium]|jgi:zinc transport system substrate-binding protein
MGIAKNAKIKKILFFIVVISLVSVVLFALLSTKQKTAPTEKPLTIVTTLYPLYDFAKQVGQANVNVVLLLPPGVEPHSFEPKPSDVVKINEADVFVYTGSFMEPWAADIIAGSDKNLKIVDASVGIEMMKEADHEPGVDPHIWLDFANAKIIVNNITQALIAQDPANSTFYQTNAKNYNNQLTELDNHYAKTLATCKSNEIIYGGHYAFGYLAKKYQLNYTAAQGLAPDAEPTATDLINLVDQIKQNQIAYVFYEELASPKIAETLANETAAKLLLLNAAHNVSQADMQSNVTFINIMNDNLASLSTGLQCKL